MYYHSTHTLTEAAADLNRRLIEICYELVTLVEDARSEIGYASTEDFVKAVADVKHAQKHLASSELVKDAAQEPENQSHSHLVF